MVNRLLRQFGEHSNDYSVLEIGDTLNEIIDILQTKGVIDMPVIAPIVESKESVTEVTTNIFPARSPSSGDRVYLIENDKKRWIKNAETLEKLGYNFHVVKNLSNDELDKYEVGEDIDLHEYESSKDQDGKSDKYNL